ncbi:MAG: hypothetical protein CML29_10710 [Rhizobiales bacterium]|nr:hypothetical protein [Hyphomicrobiales bacterium]|tara:strand:- start:678 stop:1676 length:999 start_codon:yes stop_codon:yes gene_type:complete
MPLKYVPALALAAAMSSGAAKANDSIAELGAGGVLLARTDAVELAREQLFLSAERVTVDYVFVNRTGSDVETVVAFPMPVVSMGYDTMPPVVSPEDNNFMDFSVVHDGAPITPELDQRAMALGIDVTRDLEARNVPLMPLSNAAWKALEKLDDGLTSDWVARGIVSLQEWDEGGGMQAHRLPRWELASTFWWRSTFPAGGEVAVSHRYTPAVGASAGVFFINPDGSRNEVYNDYAARYCIDDSFEQAVAKAVKSGVYFTEKRIDYVLTSGGNWASGLIGDFRMTIDKGDPGNLVSFCGTGVKKTAPTQFQMSATDFYPEKDIHILILERLQQ